MIIRGNVNPLLTKVFNRKKAKFPFKFYMLGRFDVNQVPNKHRQGLSIAWLILFYTRLTSINYLLYFI